MSKRSGHHGWIARIASDDVRQQREQRGGARRFAAARGTQYCSSRARAVPESRLRRSNSSTRDVKDLDVECTMYTPGGAALGEARRTVYDVVPARADRMFRDFSMGTIHGQANTARCNAIGLANGADSPR